MDWSGFTIKAFTLYQLCCLEDSEDIIIGLRRIPGDLMQRVALYGI